MGGVGVHFVVYSTFCLQNGFFQPTKWYGHKLDYKMAFPSLRNGMAQTRPYKMVFLCQLYWTCSFPTILIFSSKNGRTCAFLLQKKTPGPFCKASTLSGTQLQGQFFRSHFVGFFTLSQFHPKLISKNVSQFLHVAKPYFFLQTIC